MVLIIGGAWQGKLTWAKREYHLAESDICDLADGFVPGKRCYTHWESLTARGEQVELPAHAIVIAREIGSGVVPMDASARAWRERHGKSLQALAQQAERVVRIFCGLPEELK